MNQNTPIQDERRGKTSASSALPDSLCKGRHMAQRGLPEVEDKSSEHGTDIHAALAKQDPAGLTLDQQETYDACMEIEKVVIAQVFGNDVLQMDAKPIREQRFWIKFKDQGETEHSAQIDCAYRRSTRGLIVEYKTLSGEVPGSPNNLQLRDQVVLFDQNTPMLSEVVVVVIQPWVTRKPQLALYTRDDIAKARNEMYERIIASNDTNSPRTPGEVQCKWCKAATSGTCQEHNAWAGGLAAGSMGEQSLLDAPHANWTPEQCVRFLERLSVAEKWLDDAKAAMKARLKDDPEAIPGYTLGFPTGKVTETIINAQAVFDLFSQRGGSLTQFMQCITIGKGKLKEALADITKAKGKKLDAELELVIGDNHTFKDKEPSLVKKK